MVLDRLYQQVFFAIVVASVASIGTWKVQNWRHGAKETERVEAQLEVVQANAATSVRRLDRVIDSQSASASRMGALRTAAESARAERDGLLLDLAASQQRLASQPKEACIERAAALNDVFEQCTKRHLEVAEKADRHASDVKTLSDGWPE